MTSSLTHNPVLPNIKEVINKHWHILSIDSSCKEIFNNLQPMIAIRKNINLKQLIGTQQEKTKNFSHLHKQQPQVNVPHVTLVGYFAASQFSKQQHKSSA